MLTRDFESLTVKENESVESFITTVKNVVNSIHAHCEYLEDRKIVEFLFKRSS
jgi:hypothetical protein